MADRRPRSSKANFRRACRRGTAAFRTSMPVQHVGGVPVGSTSVESELSFALWLLGSESALALQAARSAGFSLSWTSSLAPPAIGWSRVLADKSQHQFERVANCGPITSLHGNPAEIARIVGPTNRVLERLLLHGRELHMLRTVLTPPFAGFGTRSLTAAEPVSYELRLDSNRAHVRREPYEMAPARSIGSLCARASCWAWWARRTALSERKSHCGRCRHTMPALAGSRCAASCTMCCLYRPGLGGGPTSSCASCRRRTQCSFAVSG